MGGGCGGSLRGKWWPSWRLGIGEQTRGVELPTRRTGGGKGEWHRNGECCQSCCTAAPTLELFTLQSAEKQRVNLHIVNSHCSVASCARGSTAAEKSA